MIQILLDEWQSISLEKLAKLTVKSFSVLFETFLTTNVKTRVYYFG